jgi:hypothetical protein
MTEDDRTAARREARFLGSLEHRSLLRMMLDSGQDVYWIQRTQRELRREASPSADLEALSPAERMAMIDGLERAIYASSVQAEGGSSRGYL